MDSLDWTLLLLLGFWHVRTLDFGCELEIGTAGLMIHLFLELAKLFLHSLHFPLSAEYSNAIFAVDALIKRVFE